MATVLITGGSSYLGQQLVPTISASSEIAYTYHQNDPLGMAGGYQLDVRDAAAVAQLVDTLKPETIMHTVGSNRSEDMSKVIVDGTTHVTRAAKKCGARLIHISTDSLFDGRDAPYDESSPPSPLHEYGRAKAEAEAIAARHDNHVIVRTSLIYGLDRLDRSTAWIAGALRAGQPVTLFTNQIRNPVWIDTLCHACLELAHLPFQGILNVAGGQAMSRAEFGLRLLDWWQITERDTLILGKSDADVWPADCTLLLNRAHSLLQVPLLGVDEVLDENQGNFKARELDAAPLKKL